MIMRFISDLICPRHSNPNIQLFLEPLYCRNNECVEGFLTCQFCHTTYPIIDGVAVLVENFVKYCETRVSTFGSWLTNSKTSEMKSYLKSNGRCIASHHARNDRYEIGGSWFVPYRWAQYDYSSHDKFLNMLKLRMKPNEFYSKIVRLAHPRDRMVVLDMGCSLGYSTFELAKKCSCALGIDLSFSFIVEARKRLFASDLENVEFFVSDALQTPFSSLKFDLIMALNLLDLVQPNGLISSIHKLLKNNGLGVFADPYDYRIKLGPTRIVDGQVFRTFLENSGFELMQKTLTEFYIPWIIKIYERSYLFYFVDLVMAKKALKGKIMA